MVTSPSEVAVVAFPSEVAVAASPSEVAAVASPSEVAVVASPWLGKSAEVAVETPGLGAEEAEV